MFQHHLINFSFLLIQALSNSFGLKETVINNGTKRSKNSFKEVTNKTLTYKIANLYWDSDLLVGPAGDKLHMRQTSRKQSSPLPYTALLKGELQEK